MISLITVSDAHPERVRYHRDLCASVAQQTVPVEWLWVIPDTGIAQNAYLDARELLEGSTVTLRALVSEEGATVGERRNRALNRAQHPFVANLDDDDLLIGCRSLENRLRPLVDRPELGWTAARIEDVHDDLSVSQWGDQLEPGSHVTGRPETLDLLLNDAGRPRFHASTMLMRSDLAREVGGWDGELHQAEDIALVLRLARRPGYMEMLPQKVLAYRKHGAQMTKTEGFSERDTAILQRLAAR